MELQDRFLSQDMTGGDVALLHRELGAIAAKYGLALPPAEVAGQSFGPGTKRAVARYQEQNAARLLALSGASGERWPGTYGVVDTATAAAINQDYDQLPPPLSVSGLARDDRGYPIKGVFVQAFDQDMRARQPLGTAALTDATGHFRIEYDAAAFTGGGVGTADLSFEIGGANETPQEIIGLRQINDGRQAPSGGLMVLFNAAPQAEIIITVRTAANPAEDEYSHLRRVIAAVTEVEPIDFETADIDFLTAEFARIDPVVDNEKLTALVEAERLAREAYRPNAEIPAAAFYGLAREGLPLALTALAVVPSDEILHRLRRAIADRLVPAELGARLDAIIQAIARLAASALLNAKETEEHASLGDLLAAAGLNQDEQAAVLAAFVEHTGDLPEFWANLRALPALRDPAKVDAVQYALTLAWLVQGQTAVWRGLRKAYPRVRSIRELYQKLDPERLRAIIVESGFPPQTPDADPEARANDSANEILNLLAASFPTDAVARLLPALPAAHFGDEYTHALVSRFFERAVKTDFDLRTSRVDDLVAAQPEVIGATRRDAQTRVINQVKRVQRLFRLSADAASLGALLGSGLDSAREIARVPPASFLARFGASFANVEQARLIYDRALTSSAAAEFLYTQIFHSLNGAHMAAADAKAPDFQAALLKNFPNLSELFGSLEMCECEDCRSVLSPAAYFVDLLEFLRNSTPNPAGVTPFGVLVGDAGKSIAGRRPDLPFIPLTCENTNTEMPFVDLVNEILESYVVLGKLDASVAKDNAGATEPELSANAQYTDPKAYNALRGAVFPLALPYDQGVDALRVYLDHLNSSRYDLLRALDLQDGSVAPLAEQAAEYLGIFPAEFEALTGSQFGGASSALIPTIPAAYGLTDKELAPALAPGAQGLAVRALQRQLNAAGQIPALTINDTFDAATQAALKAFQTNLGFPATGVPDAAAWNALGGNDPDALEVFLSDVPEFLRRTGIAYPDLIDLLKTEFTNPGFQALQFLEDHGISYADVDDLAKSGFTVPNANILKALLDPSLGMTQAQFIAWVQLKFPHLGEFIVLRSGPASCDLSATAIVRLNGQPVGDKTWYRINRFIRLWRRMGWSIRDLDRAILASGSFDIDLALILILRVISRLTSVLKLAITPVLSFWANIETQGPDSLYERLFRSRTLQKIDDHFALNPERSELQTTDDLSKHVPALLAALRVSEADLGLLRTGTGLTDPSGGTPAQMNLASLSLLYRHATLAAGLRLSVGDFLALKRIVPFDPFITSAFGPANTELFVDAALKVKASRFSVGLLRYLFLGEDTAPATFEPLPESVNQWLARLRAELIQISVENAPGEDPHGERTRERLSLLFESAIADQATRMIDGSAPYTAPVAGLPAGFAFPAALARRISYDPATGLLRLTGVMTSSEQTTLKALSAGLAAPLKTVYENAVDALFAQPRTFVKDVLGSQGVFLTVADAEAAIFNVPAFDEFGNPTWLDATGKPVALDEKGKPVTPTDPPPVVTAVAAHFRYFLDHLLPMLRGQLDRALIEQRVADAFALDPDLTQALVEDSGVLHLPTPPTHPILDDLLALEGDGLTGEYFSAPLLAGVASTRIDPGIAFDFSTGSAVPGGAVTPFSVRWKGFLLAPADGTHTFHLRADGNAKLIVNGIVLIDAWTTPAATELQATLPLKAGQICAVEIDFSTTKFGGVVEWRWSNPAMAKALVPQAQLYTTASRATLNAPRSAYRLLNKAALLLKGFALNAADVKYLSSHAVDFDGFDLSALPLAISLPNPALFTQWARLYDFAALRDDLPAPGGGPGLISVLGAAAAHPPGALSVATTDAYLTLTGVDLTAAAKALGLKDGDLRTEKGLGRAQTLLDLARQTQVGPDTLHTWATTDANLGPSEEIKRIVKARYDETVWPTIARPLNDVLRDHQRTALVAYLVPRLGLENSNQLYEFLLIDVDMGTCMGTSRIVQAIAAVQLFVQRCLLGVEGDVAVSAIDPRRWDWMSSYRLWEANRQVYLFPENWMEPALRDDKSPFFTDLESDLLQTDLTAASAETAFFNYLYKLEDVARLDLVGEYVQDKSDGNLTDDVVHLFGRTIHNPHEYYYRRRINNAVWTPWERVQVDIEGVENGADSGVHLLPVVWNRRLYLFWPQFMERSKDDRDLTQTESAAHKKWRTDHDNWQKAKDAWKQWVAQGKPDIYETRISPNGKVFHVLVPPPTDPGAEPLEPQDDTSIQRPPKYLDISIAWSEYTGAGRWSPKQTTSHSAQCNCLDRKSYIFQAVPLNDGTLSVNFLAHPVTDDHWTHNPLHPQFIQEIRTSDPGIDAGEFLFTGCRGDIETSFNYFDSANAGRLGIVLPDATAQDYVRFQQQEAKPGLVLNVGEYLKLNVRIVGDVLIQKFRRPLKLLSKTPAVAAGNPALSRFHLLYPHELPQFVGQSPFCYQDDLRDYFVTPEPGIRWFQTDYASLYSVLASVGQAAAAKTLPTKFLTPPTQQLRLDQPAALLQDQNVWGKAAQAGIAARYRQGTQYFLFEPLFHPYACAFVRTLRRGGIGELLATNTQRLTDLAIVTVPGGVGGAPIPVGFTNNFEKIYGPTSVVLRPYPMEDVDFTANGAYSLYNWELFFHAVLLVADSLSLNQRFDESQRWFHYIFNPMTSDGGAKPARYWNFLPFKDVESDRLAEMMLLLSQPDSGLTAAQLAKKHAYAQQWQLLKDNPYRPYVVARLRPLAFMKNTAMKYIDNLIRWGDQLFARDTRESINEATQLYVLASELLGPLVQKTPQRGRVAAETYDSLVKKQIGGKLDAFSNGLVTIEQEFPFSAGLSTGAGAGGSAGPVLGDTLYFCIPQNGKLLGYWDTVADRLFKIRHCLNMAGVARDLPLFAPPIDPALLVNAVAHGVDLSTVLNDLNTPAPLYRFTTVCQKALDVCNDVRTFGGALLAALEKRDAEALAQLRAGQEASLLNLVKEIRTQQLLEAQSAKEALDRTAETVTHKQQYYANLPDRIAYEATQVSELDTAQKLLNDGQTSEQFASMIASYLPDTSIGTSGNGAHFTATFGRGNLIAQYQSEAHEKSFLSGQHTHASGMAATLGVWMRRRTEWKFQAEQAEKELAQVQQQIEAAKIRIAIAQRELSNHQQQTEDAQRIDAFLRDKFTNADLYTWTAQQVSLVYFQSYKMACDLARKAEKAYRFELGLTSSSFIQYGYWDDLYKGLMAGERLHLALRQMERSYLDLNRRDYEITRHVSLLLHDPAALMELKLTGHCEVELPETFFDADYPGHYLRRIKTASVTIPAVVGPYTSVNCTLTLLKNKTRINSIVGDSYPERLDADDDRFVSNFASIQSVATSTAQNDSGMFELNFRDERYLPFEGAGAASFWSIDMPPDNNAFDFSTISDVVLHLRYTAREGGLMLRKAASAAREEIVSDPDKLAQARLFSLRHEFPTEWARFCSPTDATAAAQELTLELPMERFSYRFRGWQMHVQEVEVLMPLRNFRDATGQIVDALGEYKTKPLDIGLTFLAPNGTTLASNAAPVKNTTLTSNSRLLDGAPYLHWKVAAPQDVPVRLRLEVTEAAVKALKPSLQTAAGPLPTARKRLNADAIEDMIVILHFSADRV